MPEYPPRIGLRQRFYAFLDHRFVVLVQSVDELLARDRVLRVIQLVDSGDGLLQRQPLGWIDSGDVQGGAFRQSRRHEVSGRLVRLTRRLPAGPSARDLARLLAET